MDEAGGDMARLNGPKKAAIMLLSIGEDAAAEVMKNLQESEIKEVMVQMNRVSEITLADVERVTNEFYRRTEIEPRRDTVPPETKMQFLSKTLSKALGKERSDELLGKVMDLPSRGAIEKLKWYAPKTIAEVISGEHPQVIAAILACFDDPQLASEVISELPAPLRGPVMDRLAKIKGVPEAWVKEIEASLDELFAPKESQREPFGQRLVAGMIGGADKQSEREMLAQLESKDPKLAGEIKGRIVRFEDFIRLDGLGVQKILEESQMDDVLLALRTAEESLRKHILENVSINTSNRIRAQLKTMPPTRVGDIEKARKRLALIATGLAQKGEITFLGK